MSEYEGAINKGQSRETGTIGYTRRKKTKAKIQILMIERSTCGTRRVTLVTYPVISHELGNDRIVLTTNGTYPWSFVTQILRNG